MDRRGFLGSILAACAAPAIVRASSLMRVIAPPQEILTFADYAAAGAYLDAADLNFTETDLVLTIDNFSSRVIRPALAMLAERIDRECYMASLSG